MIVYADILIVLNLIVDYFLLLAVSKILRIKYKFLRLLLAAIEGGIFSLYIYLPQSFAVTEFALRVIICFVMILTAFGFRSLKDFLKVSGLYFGITCLYAGIMTAFWKIFRPQGMIINNSVVYFDISAITLIVCTVIFYFLFTALSKIFESNGKFAKKCKVIVTAQEKHTEFSAIVDTGNSVNDVLGMGEVIIADKTVAVNLFGDIDINGNPSLKSRYRVIPLATVSGDDMLEGFRCDSACVTLENQTVKIKNPILAVSKTTFDSSYSGIINPKILNLSR